MSKNALNIAVISQYSFPYGGAATNRIISYCSGMVNNGAQVDVIIPFQTDYHSISRKELPDSDIYKGISYYYSFKRYRSKYKIIRFFFSKIKLKYFFGFLSAFFLLLKLSKTKQYDAFVISSDTILLLSFFCFCAHYVNAKVIFIFDEYPVPIRHKLKDKIPAYKSFLYSKVLQKFDAYISISEQLKQFYCSLVSKPTFILPVIVDIDKFNLQKPTIVCKQLCYMGNLELAKDNVDLLIKAFERISKSYPDIQLNLYGNPSPSNQKYLSSVIKSLSLEDKVLMKGFVRSDEVPTILIRSYILVSSQPNTTRAAGGFPTKLGEYLATGIPSLFTDVGENSRYVNDGEHTFFAKPNDISNYAEKLEYIIEHYDDACKVAKNGQHFILMNYSSFSQGGKMITFIKSLL